MNISSSKSVLTLSTTANQQRLNGGPVSVVNGQKAWCVAKPSSDHATLLANINHACSQADCKILQKGSPCFYPDNLMNDASVAVKLYYQIQ